MDNLTFDVCIIGSGPAGQKAAISASKAGKSVAIIEEGEFIGGACLNSGTIPSKTLRAAILDLTDFYNRSFYGKDYHFGDISISDLNYRLDYVLNIERATILRHFKKNKIQVYFGTAKFESQNILLIFKQDALTYRIKADTIIIASGSKPRNPEGIPFDDEVILDSTRLLKIDEIPKNVLVLGGGIIGSEYASFFAALGAQVTIIDKKHNLLPLLDREIGIHLQNGLSELGLQFVGNKEPDKIYREKNQAYVKCKDGSLYQSDVLLYALGRAANVHHLQIENANIQLNERGYIPVNANFQTCQPHIYAVGDVVGSPALASTSMEQGRLAAKNACGDETHPFPEAFPIGIYTIPEISSCGMTEEEARKKGFNYEVGRAYYYEISAAHIYGASEVGMFKLIFHRDTLELLGVHIIGRQATEVIHIGQLALLFNAKIDYFVNQIFNYPTFAEGYRIAALNGINKVRKK
jgi:NAD(P) transhydrogenase